MALFTHVNDKQHDRAFVYGKWDFFNVLPWMVGLVVDVKWDVVGFSVGQVRAVRQVEGDVKEIHDFLVGFNCDLKERGYKKAYVEGQIDKVRRMSRVEVLSNNNQPRSTRTPFVVTYHPQLPDISKILRELHPILESSERCKNAIKVFHLSRLGNRRDYLVRAKVDSPGP